MFSTRRTDPDIILLGLLGVVVWYFFGLMPASLIFGLASYFIAKRDSLDDNDSKFWATVTMALMMAAPIVGFVYSFSCPAIWNDAFGVAPYYAALRSALGIEECWAFGTMLHWVF